jgi:hypothetical protein
MGTRSLICNLEFFLTLFTSSDIIVGLPALKQLNVVINPSFNTFTLGDFKLIAIVNHAEFLV